MLLALIATACRDEIPRSKSESMAEPVSELHARSLALSELHEPAPTVGSGDWLAEHEEPGQTFAEYLDEDPVAATAGRRRIYVVPIGEFDAGRQQVFDRTVEAVRHWFGLEVVVEAAVPLSAIPQNSMRQSNHGDWLQLHAGYLMRRVLRPNLPADAACRIGFVSADLWPGRGWNFVFGQASLRDRIGVWSLYRNGDPNESKAAARLCLLRTVKTATHEIGHMFGMRHCTAWSCNLAGSNHQAESDRQPWRLCPECLPKLLRATGVDAGERFVALRRFGDGFGLAAEAEWFARAGDAWRSAR
ncbi:MAG: archaemetzincin [bacterium]|nr:archaemetzincin [bacterium]